MILRRSELTFEGHIEHHTAIRASEVLDGLRLSLFDADGVGDFTDDTAHRATRMIGDGETIVF